MPRRSDALAFKLGISLEMMGRKGALTRKIKALGPVLASLVKKYAHLQ
jgi:hypothetical protein